VVLGLVTTNAGALERAEDPRRRLDEASRYVPLDRLCVSPRCGFSSTVEGHQLAVEPRRAELAPCGKLGREAWDSL
jgi:5-methyltetrahydropteroyltriglutamate--homocysteine methyltransferase